MRHNVPEADEILDQKVPLLNHGGVALLDYMGSDKAIEQAARVSFVGDEEEERTPEQTRGLIRYLVRHKHTTPLEMVELKFWVKCPIFVARQWIRHRTANVNEISGRYAALPDQFYVPDLDRINVQSKSNKQGSTAEVLEDAEDIRAHMEGFQSIAYRDYEDYLDKQMAKEIARINLPLSLYTEFVWKIDLHNLMHFLALRMDSHAQKEIRVFADAMADMTKRVAPVSFEAFEDYRLNAVSFSGPAMSALRTLLADLSEEDISAELENYGVRGREAREVLAALGVVK